MCHLVATFVFVPSFVEVEKKAMEEHLIQAVTLINTEVGELDGKTADWAWWDDTYQFMQNKNDAYIENNVIDEAFINLQLNFMIFIDTSGQIVYAIAYDYVDKQPISDVSSFTTAFLENIQKWNFTDLNDGLSGVILCPNHIAIVSAKPILTSQITGPIVGTMIFGRLVDETMTEHFSKILGVQVAFAPYDDSQSLTDVQTTKAVLSQTSPTTVMVVNKETITGYTYLKDVYSKPAVILKIIGTREVYASGVALSNFYLAASLVMCIALSLTLILLIEKAILKPIRKLTDSVKTLSKNGEVNSIKIGGKDETGVLAEAVKDVLTQRLKAIEELAGMVGHDLRNPLQSITGAVYYIKNKCGDKIDDKCKVMLKTIEDSVEYSNKIVNDLLSYAGQVVLYRSETTPKALIADVVSSSKIPANIQLIDLTEDSPKLHVDVTKIKRAFLNIISNAVEAMPNGGKLTVKSEKEKGFVNIMLSDTGLGIPKEVIDKMGKPLFTTKAKGIGLGFPIAKRFVEAHGGSIKVKSAEGKGTTITVQLPINEVDNTISENKCVS